MTKYLMPIALVLLGMSATSNAWAEPIKISEVSCTNAKSSNPDEYLDIEIHLLLSDMEFQEGALPAQAGSAQTDFVFNIKVSQSESQLAPFSSFEAATASAKKVANTSYTPRKYKDHFRFDLEQGAPKWTSGFLNYDRASLIFNPEYKVVKSFEEHNLHDPSWRWTTEIRQHPAVLDLSVNDHHGDYLPLKCYSVGMTNIQKPKRNR